VTTDAKRVFVDTNILASALLPESPRYFHARGILRRLAEADAEVWISRQVIREYLATMTRYEPKWSMM
jgi:predicted nucleic acid-binding protein